MTRNAGSRPPLIHVDPEARVTTYTYFCEPDRAAPEVEHDAGRRLFRITDPDGCTATFCDEPVRFLLVEPDARTGRFCPVLKHGQPQYLYLCREERERG